MSAREHLRAYLGGRDDREAQVAPHMRSRLLAGTNGDVVVLVHGLTASPPAWGAIAAAINARGATVVVPRLPLHGHADRLTHALRGLHAEQLTRDMHELLERIATLGGRMTVAGHSLGGTLAIHAAAHFPHVDRIVAIAPFLGISYFPHEIHAPLIGAMRLLPDFFLWWDPVLREKQLPPHGYPRYPLRALHAGMRIAEDVYREADAGTAARAIDVVLNERESSVNNRTVVRLVERWREAGSSVALHRLRGLPRSHDIIEPERIFSARALPVLVDIIAGEHTPADVVHPLL
ncbi:MAG: hypothetical protein NVSMB64_21350 [Candidatus Velthaea sp.]